MASTAVAAVAFAPAARAADPGCGDELHHDVKLHHNVDCSASNSDALIIGKNGLTVDLNGHTITGPGGGAGSYYGIDDGGGYDRLTVENGTIKNYAIDVYLYGASHSKVRKVHLALDGSHAYEGLDSEYGTGDRFLHNTSAHGSEGLYVLYGSANKLVGNKVEDARYGIDIEYENGTVAIKNSATHGYSSTYGMEDYRNYDVAWHDNVSNRGEYGFWSDYPTKTLFEGGTANNNSYAGIYVDDNYSTSGYSVKIRDNKANGNATYGMYAAYPAKGGNNTAIGNGSYDCYYVICNAKVAGKQAVLFDSGFTG